ncbi:hypothetical protein BGW36DRAFT_368191 [Talaromyces proteolyticus]|uniref:SnoaL-like domain-containing protein n=1 Tax=Talaromyces proteolyticus TaxID=1131652 RepID=A0AAD4L3A1_9EURO|nr:uncharacterized protein BGW36DRAFT_368191 [Talaromyces proteolyticus]KAH8705801.1 hypothetical protein BGW36DRAFT_368191 [Talaromyces proteolyticus]
MSTIALESLTLREAITDALYRCIVGLDTADFALFKSAWLVDDPETAFVLLDTSLIGFDNINEHMYKKIAPLQTTHTTSNIRIDVKDGAKEATATSHFIAQHFREGEGLDPTTKHLLTGGVYFVDFVKDDADGLWKVKKWDVRVSWLEGDAAIVGR